jgi:hypothetical protein
MSGVELVLAFLGGVAAGIALDRWLLPPLVDAWIDRLRRQKSARTLTARGGIAGLSALS